MAKFCASCSTPLLEGAHFCIKCGILITEENSVEKFPEDAFDEEFIYDDEMLPDVELEDAIMEAEKEELSVGKFDPVSVGGFVGLTLLYSIPVVGLIVCIVMAFAAKKINTKNFARANVVLRLGSLLLTITAIITGLVLGALGFMYLEGEFTTEETVESYYEYSVDLDEQFNNLFGN